MAAGGEGRSGESGHMRVWLPFTVRLKLSQHFLLTGYTPNKIKRSRKAKLLETEWPGGCRGGGAAGEAVGHAAAVVGCGGERAAQ